MRAAPIVGITSYLEDARFSCWRLPATVLPATYAEAVARSGGVPVLLPPLGSAAAALPALDALVLSGGADLDPALYGQEPLAETTATRPDRDRFELELLEGAIEAKLPVLGICRGMQLLNVARGGTLDQHIPHYLGHTDHLPAPGRFGSHEIATAPDSRLRELLGPGTAVASHHHQGVATVGEGLEIAAWAPDATIEALELRGEAFVLGVQWHPEATADRSILEELVSVAFVGAARERSAA